MFKHLLILVFSFISVPVFCMQNNALQQQTQSQTQINVWTLVTKDTIIINDQTTVSDVKNDLYNSQGVPVMQQKLHAIWPKLSVFGWWIAQDHSAELEDDTVVKEVMDNYNTVDFSLCLKSLTPRATGPGPDGD